MTKNINYCRSKKNGCRHQINSIKKIFATFGRAAIGCKTEHITIFSDCLKTEPNSPRSARGQFLRPLQSRCDIIVINEHNTTKLCGRCNGKLEVWEPPKRFSQCVSCHGNKRLVIDIINYYI